MNLSKVLVAALVVVAVIAAVASATALGILLTSTGVAGNGVPGGNAVLTVRGYGTSSALGTQACVLTNAVTTSATATVYVVPSKVVIYLSIETTKPYMNATQAYEDVVNRADGLVSKLKSIEGVVYVQTLSMRLNPQYEWTKGEKVFKGYVATYTLAVEAETAVAGKVIAEAVKASIDSIRGITFAIPDDELEKAKEEALKVAVRKAYEKAKAIVSELNATLGNVIYVTTEYSSLDYIVRYMKEAAYTAAAGQPPELPIEVGKGFPVMVTVQAAFEIIHE